MIITIGGPAGSGKGSVAKIIAKRLHLKRYSGGDFRRNKAKELGMTIEQYNTVGENEDFTDKEADEWQKNLGRIEDNFIMDSRLGYYFIPNSVKVLLEVNDDEAARRIFNDKNSERFNQNAVHNIGEQKNMNIKRNESDRMRYEKYYGIKDFSDPKHYDIVIDTTNITPDEAAQKIIDYVNKKHYK